MWIPFLTSRYSTSTENTLERRIGGGGGGRGGGGRGGGGRGGGGRSGKGPKSSSSKAGRRPTTSISVGGTRKTASPQSYGGGAITTIPSGEKFSGRQAGGGDRSQVMGSQYYGSGYPQTIYPGTVRPGVAGRGFPFYYWPVVWGAAVGVGLASYFLLDEFGSASNSERPGGSEKTATFYSSTSNTTLRILSDDTTVKSLIEDIRANTNCTLASNSSTSPATFDDSRNDTLPRPEQAIQYYRASSVVLSMDGYNNSAVYIEDADENAPNSPLPSWHNAEFVNCLNSTIENNVPLFDNAAMTSVIVPLDQMQFLGVAWIGLFLSQFFV